MFSMFSMVGQLVLSMFSMVGQLVLSMLSMLVKVCALLRALRALRGGGSSHMRIATSMPTMPTIAHNPAPTIAKRSQRP